MEVKQAIRVRRVAGRQPVPSSLAPRFRGIVITRAARVDDDRQVGNGEFARRVGGVGCRAAGAGTGHEEGARRAGSSPADSYLDGIQGWEEKP